MELVAPKELCSTPATCPCLHSSARQVAQPLVVISNRSLEFLQNKRKLIKLWKLKPLMFMLFEMLVAFPL